MKPNKKRQQRLWIEAIEKNRLSTARIDTQIFVQYCLCQLQHSCPSASKLWWKRISTKQARPSCFLLHEAWLGRDVPITITRNRTFSWLQVSFPLHCFPHVCYQREPMRSTSWHEQTCFSACKRGAKVNQPVSRHKPPHSNSMDGLQKRQKWKMAGSGPQARESGSDSSNFLSFSAASVRWKNSQQNKPFQTIYCKAKHLRPDVCSQGS